ncbi:hypothetical protein G9A89_014358 [Geosiphon pyriformis]|nr:hypothetical protein G9A89_014358 [Geosiphon pyriformis]
MSKEIQLPIWKKTKIELLTNPSYHYILRSAINIISTGASTSITTSTFGQFPFQSKQRKEDLLRLYDVNTANLSNPNNAAIILTTNISTNDTSNLSTTAATNNLSGISNLNTATKLSTDNIRESQTKGYPKLEIVDGCSPTDPQFFQPTIRIQLWNLGTGYTQNPNSQHYLSLLVTPEDTVLDTPKSKQQQALTNNILPAIITENILLDTIFLFELKELLTMLLFNRAALEEKPITAMYTDAKVDNHFIKLILDSKSADSIITRQLIDQLGY